MSSKDEFAKLLHGKDEPSLVQRVLPGLSLSKILSDIGDELKHQGAMGAQELAAGLFRNHDGFVLYQKSAQDGVEQDQGPSVEPMQEKQIEGREM
jgi:hypothetical protein